MSKLVHEMDERKINTFLHIGWFKMLVVNPLRCPSSYHGWWVTVVCVYIYLCLINQQDFSFVQLWDLDNILQGPSTQRNETAVIGNEVDSDNEDEMDVDNNRSKSSKGKI